jgi:O-antigen/teichoic acid export membrane protein
VRLSQFKDIRSFSLKELASGSSGFWLVALGGWVGRAFQILTQLVAIRILTDALGAEGYSVFAVLASLTGWLALTDLSIAISVQNQISEHRVRGTSTDDVVVTGAWLALLSTVAFSILVIVSAPWLSGELLDEFRSLTAHQRTLAFLAMAFPAIGAALGNVAYRVLFARHQGYISNLLPAVGTALGTLAVWVLTRTNVSFLLGWSTLVYYAPVALVPLVTLVILLRRASAGGAFRRDIVRPLMTRACRFWVFGIAASAVLQVDYVIAAQVLTPKDIVTYNVAGKIFSLVLFFYSAVLHALWPVCSEAIAAGAWTKVLRQTRTYIVMGFALTILSGMAFLFLQSHIIAVLTPSIGISVPIIVIVLLTIYTLVRIWADTFGMLLQSMDDLKVFWFAIPIQAALSIVLQAAGAHFYGLPGMIAGLVLCFVLTTMWILPIRCFRHAKRVTSS